MIYLKNLYKKFCRKYALKPTAKETNYLIYNNLCGGMTIFFAVLNR